MNRKTIYGAGLTTMLLVSAWFVFQPGVPVDLAGERQLQPDPREPVMSITDTGGLVQQSGGVSPLPTELDPVADMREQAKAFAADDPESNSASEVIP